MVKHWKLTNDFPGTRLCASTEPFTENWQGIKNYSETVKWPYILTKWGINFTNNYLFFTKTKNIHLFSKLYSRFQCYILLRSNAQTMKNCENASTLTSFWKLSPDNFVLFQLNLYLSN